MIHNLNLKYDGEIDEFYNINQLKTKLECINANLRDFKIQTLNDFDEYKSIQKQIDKLKINISKQRTENIYNIIAFDKLMCDKLIPKILIKNEDESFSYLEHLYIQILPEDLFSSLGYIKFFNRYSMTKNNKRVRTGFKSIEDIEKDFSRFNLLNRFLNFIGLDYTNLKVDFLMGRYKIDQDIYYENFKDNMKSLKFDINVTFDDETFQIIFDIVNIQGKWMECDNKIHILGNYENIKYEDLINKKILFQFFFLDDHQLNETFTLSQNLFYF